MASALGAAVTLYLVRHGAAAGAEGRCVGHADLPLAPGAREALARLAEGWPHPRPPRLVASDLARARESAAVLAAEWGAAAPVPADARLREMNFGRWDGRTWADLEREDGPALGAWMADWQNARAPGGEGFDDVIARAAEWLRDTVAAAQADGVREVAAVAHAGSIRALLVHAFGLPKEVAFRVRVDHATVTGLRFAGGELDADCRRAELLFSNAEGERWNGRSET
ncbi:phosphoglycerate mutase [Gemmatimonadetes bacterium T265]|nr:phosphoglycerate mutase [Gemmatimonadetes bacterium T265]